MSLAQKISNTFKPKQNMDQVITNYDRSYGIQKIFSGFPDATEPTKTLKRFTSIVF